MNIQAVPLKCRSIYSIYRDYNICFMNLIWIKGKFTKRKKKCKLLHNTISSPQSTVYLPPLGR